MADARWHRLPDYSPRVIEAIRCIKAAGEMSTDEWRMLARLVALIASYRHLREEWTGRPADETIPGLFPRTNLE